MQDYESGIVILDWVHVVGGGLGVVGDNRCAHVALTRACAALNVVFSERNERHKPGWKSRSARRHNDGKKRYPLAVAHWHYLKRQGRVIEIELPTVD